MHTRTGRPPIERALRPHPRSQDRYARSAAAPRPAVRSLLSRPAAAFLIALQFNASAQSLYDKTMDAAAQQAATLAGGITSTNIFERELKNVDVLAQQDFAIYFLQSQRALRANLLQLSEGTWGDVYAAVRRIENLNLNPNRISPEALAARTLEISNKLAAVKAQLSDLQKSVAASDLPTLPDSLSRIAEVRSLEDILARLGTNQNAAVLARKLSSSVDLLSGLVTNYNAQIQAINAQSSSLADLQSLLLHSAIKRFQVQSDHIKDVAAIWNRQQDDLDEVSALLASFRGRMARLQRRGFGTNDQLIGDSIAKAAALASSSRGTPEGESLEDLLLALHEAVALYAHGEMPTRLAELRQAQEEQRYSIRLSAATAQIYETILMTGTQRLSLYYQSGVKPETLARLLRTAATIAIPVAIAAH